MRNLRCRKLNVSRKLLNSKVYRGCAKVVDVCGKTVLFFTSVEPDSIEPKIWLDYLQLNYLKPASAPLLAWERCDISSVLESTGKKFECMSLDVLNYGESMVIAFRSGELVEIQTASGEAGVVGEFVDELPERSGILALKTSPDGAVFTIVSPVKVTVMRSDWDIVAEAPLGILGSSASISWRGDGEYFVVSAKEISGAVKSTVFSREGEHISDFDLSGIQSQSNDLGPEVSWQPRAGGMICLAGPGTRLSFFERNGLRLLRSDFDTSASAASPRCAESFTRFLHLEWSVDSDKLAILSEQGNDFFIDVFIHANYKWYNKKHIHFSEKPVALLWDEDNSSTLYVLSENGCLVTLELLSTFDCVNLNASTIAVIEGKSLMVTNFANAVIPPPMCHMSIDFDACIDSVCHLPSMPVVGVLLSDGNFVIVDVGTDVKASGMELNSSPASSFPNDLWSLGRTAKFSNGVLQYRFPILLGDKLLTTVRCPPSNAEGTPHVLSVDDVCIFKLISGMEKSEVEMSFQTDGTVVATARASSDSRDVLIATDSGSLFHLDVQLNSGNPKLCLAKKYSHSLLSETILIQSLKLKISSLMFAFVLCKPGHLIAICLETGAMVLISRECTSFAASGNFVVFTTRSNVLYCIPAENDDYLSGSDQPLSLLSFVRDSQVSTSEDGIVMKLPTFPEISGATRPIDRGSVIVSFLKNDVRVILQAPRGNIETIAPRPIVQSMVRALAVEKDYGAAFRLSRQHRVDMNIMVDIDPDSFLANIELVLKQVGKASHISVFLTYLKGTTDKINSICKAVIVALKKLGKTTLFSAILTAYIRKTPPDFESALRDIWEMHLDGNSSLTTGHIDYLFVLCKDDAALYGHALGLYNLSLAVLVAKTSKELDPAEYTQELRRLQRLEDSERKYEIDLKLGRYELALRHLYHHESERQKTALSSTASEASVTEAARDVYPRSLSLAIEKAIFPTALELFQHNDEASRLLRSAYGAHFMKCELFAEAAEAYCANGELDTAAHAYENAGKWALAVGSMSRSGLDKPTKDAFYEGVADRLQELGLAEEAAHVRSSVLGDVDGALEVLFAAELWQVAIATVAAAPEAARWASVHEAVREGGAGLAADLSENAGKVRERGKRLLIVRETKRLLRERIQAAGGVDGEGSDAFSATTGTSGVSNISDLTFVGRSAATSVYSTTSGSVSAAEKRREKSAARRQRKAKKKRVKEGHPQEEEFLVQYLRRMVPGDFIVQRVKRAVDALVFFQEAGIAERVSIAMSELASEALNLAEDVIEGSDIENIARVRDWEFNVRRYFPEKPSC